MKVAKAGRIQEFFRQLESAPACASAQEALRLITETLNSVEDELSGQIYRPEEFLSDGRLYPPQEDARRAEGRAGVHRYRSRGHNTFISNEGAIAIVEVRSQRVVFTKPSAAGTEVMA